MTGPRPPVMYQFGIPQNALLFFSHIFSPSLQSHQTHVRNPLNHALESSWYLESNIPFLSVLGKVLEGTLFGLQEVFWGMLSGTK